MTLSDQQVLDIIDALLGYEQVNINTRVQHVRARRGIASLRALGPIVDRYLAIMEVARMHANDDPRRERIRAVIRDFFKDKPPGTTIEQDELDAYHRRLREAAQDRITISTSVRVGHKPDRDRGYVKESRAMRQAGDGLTGVTIAEHDSHGLCYEVQFQSGAVITYDREELEVVPSPEERTT